MKMRNSKTIAVVALATLLLVIVFALTKLFFASGQLTFSSNIDASGDGELIVKCRSRSLTLLMLADGQIVQRTEERSFFPRSNEIPIKLKKNMVETIFSQISRSASDRRVTNGTKPIATWEDELGQEWILQIEVK